MTQLGAAASELRAAAFAFHSEFRTCPVTRRNRTWINIACLSCSKIFLLSWWRKSQVAYTANHAMITLGTTLQIVIKLFVCFICKMHFLMPCSVDPKSFVIEYLEHLKNVRSGSVSPQVLFDEQNCIALFRTFDRNSSGYISIDQYKEGEGNNTLKKLNCSCCKAY